MMLTAYEAWATAIQALPFDVLPADYRGPVSTPEFVRFSVLFPNSNVISFSSDVALSGLAIFQLYTKSGYGQNAAITKAAELENLLALKNLSQVIQTGVGTLQPLGQDPADPTLFRHDYTLPFSFYGVL